jgi:saccharopine dehydrogenase-like NADP-dependent oxidoreductase
MRLYWGSDKITHWASNYLKCLYIIPLARESQQSKDSRLWNAQKETHGGNRHFFNKTKPATSSEAERFVALKTVVTGIKKGKKGKSRIKTELVCGPQKKWGLRNATAYLTGIAGSIFGQMLAKGQVREKGVVAPESAVPYSLFSLELGKAKRTNPQRD